MERQSRTNLSFPDHRGHGVAILSSGAFPGIDSHGPLGRRAGFRPFTQTKPRAMGRVMEVAGEGYGRCRKSDGSRRLVLLPPFKPRSLLNDRHAPIRSLANRRLLRPQFLGYGKLVACAGDAASPETAKALLEFRRSSLGHARKLAALYGYRGAQFPWEAAPVGGFETTPTFAATGWEEQHSTPDVALGFWEYQRAAGDEDFLRQSTWPVLEAVAEWIVSRGVFTSRGFEIHHIMGPDEGLPNVNNDAYVNLVSKMVLQAAMRCAQKVGEVPAPEWQRAAQMMYLPIDPSRNILLPCDNPPPGRNYPIGGLDMLTVHDPPISRKLFENTFDYNEGFRAKRPPAIGFATAAAAATAALLDKRHRARELFRESWQRDWMEPFGMLKEAPVETYGCFLTNCGSLLQTAMLGFTGLRIREGDWRAYPAILPEGWSRIEIDRIWVRGVPKRLVAENGKPAQLLD